MEQILAFVLGVSAVVFIWAVVVAFKTASKVRKLETDLQSIVNMIDDSNKSSQERDLALDRRIDQEIDRVDKIYRECISYTDSRVDKLDSKIENNKYLLKG